MTEQSGSLNERANWADLLRLRCHQDFPNECHLSSLEAERIADILARPTPEQPDLREGLARIIAGFDKPTKFTDPVTVAQWECAINRADQCLALIASHRGLGSKQDQGLGSCSSEPAAIPQEARPASGEEPG